MKPFGAEYLEEMVPLNVFGAAVLNRDVAGTTSSCCSYTTAFPNGATDSGDDGCGSD